MRLIIFLLLFSIILPVNARLILKRKSFFKVPTHLPISYILVGVSGYKTYRPAGEGIESFSIDYDQGGEESAA